jgi:putative SOS response-associated peptidase YedK
MCGRVRLSSDVSEIKLAFSIPPHRPAPNFPPSWNVAPTDSLPVVRFDAKAGERSLDLLRWGLVPYWAKDLKVGFANINEVPKANRRFARKAFQRRRCLVPFDSFYELAKTETGRQPLCHRTGRWGPYGAGGPLGKLAIAGWRVDAHLRDYHNNPERAVRPAS